MTEPTDYLQWTLTVPLGGHIVTELQTAEDGAPEIRVDCFGPEPPYPAKVYELEIMTGGELLLADKTP